MASTRIAIAGLGAIGRALARRLAQGVPGLALACVAVRDRAKALFGVDQANVQAYSGSPANQAVFFALL